MRQCIFVVGSREQLIQLSPLLSTAKKSGLRHSVWVTAEGEESVDAMLAGVQLSTSVVVPKRAAPASALARYLYWVPATMYRCYHYVHGVRTWTAKSPLVVLYGDSLSAWLASHAGRWGGAQLVHMQHLAGGRMPGPAILRKVRFAFSNEDDAARLAQRYAGCTVVGVNLNDRNWPQTIVDKLLRWTGGRSEDR